MELPLVLAGPIIRRVEPQLCSFWVALRDQAKVTAFVWNGTQTRGASSSQVVSGNAVIAQGSADTQQFGAKLHVAVVVVDLKAADLTLTPGQIYSYNLQFEPAGGARSDLGDEGFLKDEPASPRLQGVSADAPRHLALGYLQDQLPSFLSMPEGAAGLKFAHASCRKTTGYGPDALAWLDDHIKDTLTRADQRPRHLFLTGDQIYADEVATVLLPMLNELGTELRGANPETIPVDGVGSAPTKVLWNTTFPPMRRMRLLRSIAGFTSSSADNHLLTFGEFAAMYLCCFSPRVWQPLKTDEQCFVEKSAPDAADRPLADHWSQWETVHGDFAKWKTEKLPELANERKALEQFRAAVPQVARALANVATFMIFDDHEVTDDWNLNRSWRFRVTKTALGKAVMRNALVAYGVFQGWGNDPKAFASDGNKDFLPKAVAHLADPSADTTDLDKQLGLHDISAAPSVRWDYTVPGPAHLVRVLDTRTRRKFAGSVYPPELLGDALDQQLPAGPLADGRELLVVVSPVPVLDPVLIGRLAQPVGAAIVDIANLIPDSDEDRVEKVRTITGSEYFDLEGWGANEDALEKFLARLATYSSVVLLSGDVHSSTTLTADYWGKEGDKAKSRIVQLTSSSSRNPPFPSMLETLLRSQALLREYASGMTVERLVWLDDKAQLDVPGVPVRPGLVARANRNPAYVPTLGWPAGTAIKPGPPDQPTLNHPDARWRMCLIADKRPEPDRPPNARAPVIPAGLDPTTDPLATYRAVAVAHSQMALEGPPPLRQAVFRSNIGLVLFAADGEKLVLTHRLMSADVKQIPEPLAPGLKAAENTVHVVPLAPTDEAMPNLG